MSEKLKALKKNAFKLYKQLLAIFLFLLLWELSGRNGWGVNPLFLPPFSKVIQTLAALTANGELWLHASISLRRAGIGFVCGMGFAIPFGMALGWSRRVESYMNPLVQLFRNVPILALLPVFILFFGIGEFSKTFIVFWATIWATLINTTAGVKNIDAQLIKAARSIGTGPVRLFVTVVLPASLPHIFTGVRLSATSSILVLIASEMVGASRGLGYALYFYQTTMVIPKMYSYLVVMAVLGVTLNGVLQTVERRSFRWRGAAKE
jgi:NitT/TauT family transport system permease protein